MSFLTPSVLFKGNYVWKQEVEKKENEVFHFLGVLNSVSEIFFLDKCDFSLDSELYIYRLFWKFMSN